MLIKKDNKSWRPLWPWTMGILLGLLFGLLPVPLVAAESMDILWSQDYGGNGNQAFNCVQPTKDGGYIMAGYSYQGSGERDIFLVKTDAKGLEVWKKYYGETGDYSANWVEQTSDGGYIVAGYTCSRYQRHSNTYAMKVDAKGTKEWDRSIGGYYDEEAAVVKSTREGGYVLAGYTQSFGAGERDGYMVYLKSDGSLLWEKTYGGSWADGFNHLIQDANGSLLAVGYTQSYGDEESDIFLVKTDLNGKLSWRRNIGGSGWDSANAIIQTSAGDYGLIGYKSFPANNESDILLVRIDQQGYPLWQKSYGLANSSGVAIHETAQKGLIILGHISAEGTKAGACLLSTDASGSKIKEHFFGSHGPEQAHWGFPLNGGEYVMAGIKHVDQAQGSNGIFMRVSMESPGPAVIQDSSTAVSSIYWPDTSQYRGMVSNGKANGRGRMVLADGTVYEGEWRDNMFHGQGKMIFPDGNIYSGGFRDNMFYGWGTYTWPSGEKYSGGFRYNKRNGEGTFTWANNVQYIGEFVNDQAEGYGSITWPNGEGYTGQMQGGNPNGMGSYTFPWGEKYVGEFSGLTFSGLGTYYWANGARYVGQWQNDMMNGQGTYFWSNGVSQWGFWQDDRYIGIYPQQAGDPSLSEISPHE